MWRGFDFDKELEGKTTAEYFHLIELMWMFENFCKCYEHKRTTFFKKLVPLILDKCIEVVNCKEGNGIKISTFHLPLHFADDMIWFGTIFNYDSGICEAHHKSATKKPVDNRQRCQCNFEQQAAKR